MGCDVIFAQQPEGMQLCSPVFPAHSKLDLAPGEGKGRTSTKHMEKIRVKTKHFWAVGKTSSCRPRSLRSLCVSLLEQYRADDPKEGQDQCVNPTVCNCTNELNSVLQKCVSKGQHSPRDALGWTWLGPPVPLIPGA